MLKPAQRSVLIGRRLVQKTFGLLVLPDEFASGANAHTSKNRFVEVLAVPEDCDIPVGALAITHELHSEGIEVLGDAHRVPLDLILGYVLNEELVLVKDYVLVRPDPKESVTAGGLLIPECSIRPSTSGIVLGIGPDTKELKINNRVFYGLFAGLEIEFKGDALVILKEKAKESFSDEVLGVFLDA